jgi:3-carboxy-cis,cis-muconate cycloisomerase
MTNQVFRRLTTTPQMMSVLGDVEILQAMLDFEGGLAQAGSRCDLFEPSVADTITRFCDISEFSIIELSEMASQHGTVVVPLVNQLTKLVSAFDKPASSWVHFGATSQDVIDTAMVLQLRKAVYLLEVDVQRLVFALGALIDKFGNQIMIGRTLQQPSVPITFGQKVFGWKTALLRNWNRIQLSASEASVLQFGGAAGNLSSLGSDGQQVRTVLAEILELSLTDDVWHAHRDRIVALCSSVSIFIGGLGKVALDVSLLLQAEVSEVSEDVDFDGGRSSAMPHKRNSVNCLVALAGAKRAPHLLATLLDAMPHEHERALGGWQVEWVTIPAIFEIAAGSISAVANMCEGLKVNPEKMKYNLDSLNGLFMSERLMLELTRKIGKAKAKEIIDKACAVSITQNIHLSKALHSDNRFVTEFSSDELNQMMDLDEYLGTSSFKKLG